jgi:uncharacterized membrane protein
VVVVVAKARYSNEEIKARLVFLVGCALSITFVGAIFTLLYGLLFVVQPLEQSPNDANFLKILEAMVLFSTGALSSLLASNGLKDKEIKE